MHDQLLPLAATTSSGGIGSLIPLILIAGLAVLFITSQRRKQRANAQKQEAIEPGAEVITTAGLYATVVGLEGDLVLLEVAPGVVSRYVRGAISRVVPAGTEDDEEYDDEDGEYDTAELDEDTFDEDTEETDGDSEVDLRKGPSDEDGKDRTPPGTPPKR